MYKALHQSIRSSEKHAELSDFAERVWTRGLVAADMLGRLTANPMKFHAEAMPMLPYDEARVRAAFDELKKTRLCHFYDVDGKQFMVFHDHDEHNKGGKNLKYQNRSKIPPPSSMLCYCITYSKDEESTDASADGSAVASANVHVHVPVHVQSEDKRGLIGERRVANTLAELWNDGPGEHLGGRSALDKIQAAIDVGVNPQNIEQAFWDHKRIKGRKIWEVLDPLRPAPDNGVPSMDKILDNLAKEMRGK